MTTTNWTPTPEDAFHAIATDAFYPSLPEHDFVWHQSHNKPSALVERVIKMHILVQALQTSKKPPFDITREPGNISVRNNTDTAIALYQALETLDLQAPPKYQLSPYVQHLQAVINNLNHHWTGLSGNPLAVVSNDGLLEGELINSIAHRTKEGLKRALSDSIATARTARFNRNLSTSTRYLNRCLENYPNLHVMRLEMECLAPDIDARMASSQIGSFFTALTDHLKDNLVGYWFKREYRTEIGYTHHAILLHGGRTAYDHDVLEGDVDEHWKSVTYGVGRIYPLTWHTDNYRSHGIGTIWNQSSPALLDSVRLMLETDRYFELACAAHFPHVGMGKLPAVKKTLASDQFIGTPLLPKNHWNTAQQFGRI